MPSILILQCGTSRSPHPSWGGGRVGLGPWALQVELRAF